MSDAADQPDDQPDGTADQSDEQGDQPDLDDEDYVDVPEEMAEEVAQETAGGDDSDEDADDEGADESMDPLTSGTSVGHVYCQALGMAATLARERKGNGVDDREAAVDEYADMARQLDLDDFVDEWVKIHGGPDELSPGQGIVVGTCIFAMSVLVDDPDLAVGLSEEVGS